MKIKVLSMKTHLWISIICLSAFVSCSEFFGYSNNVDEFVKQLKAGECDSPRRLPRFDPSDIPALLDYADDFQEINCFPINNLSSYIPPRYLLGECLLWTIESVKINEGKDDWHCPSWVPMLLKEEYGNDPESGMLDNVELLEVYNLYYDWWTENSKDKEFDEFKDIDVLEGSGYFWR